MDEGDLQFSEAQEVKPILDRGKISLLRQGAEQLVDVSFSFKYQGLKGSTEPTPYEVLKGTGTASSWASTNTDSEVRTLDIDFEVNDPTTDTLVETISLAQFFHEKIEFKEGEEANIISVSGKCRSVDVV
ncbi:MAG: hypothetical protein P8012_17885 [Desulfobacterales bacterium]